MVTCVAMKHGPSGTIKSFVVRAKGGSHEQDVQMILDNLKLLGEHGKIIFRTDQENPITDLVQEVAKARAPAETVVEEVPRGDSRANGKAERGVQTAEEAVRMGVLDLEEALGEKSRCKTPSSLGS